MTEHWQQLVANFAVVALFVSAWIHGQFVVNRYPPRLRAVGMGVVMGLGAIASMVLAIPVDGVLLDLRLSMIAIASFFGGPIAALVAATLAIAYRLAVGGPTALIGAFSVLLMMGVALALREVLRREISKPLNAVALALAVAGVSLGLRAVLATNTVPASLPTVGLNTLATLMTALFMMRHLGRERERDLLRAAFLQSPDLQYVKATDSRFAAVNIGIARNSGFADPQQMIGKTDFDILEPQSAQALVDSDREILRTGRALIDVEERVVTPHGEEVWYITSKVPLYDHDGQIMGIAGATRDITARRRLQQEVADSRNQLSYVLAEMSDGIAMFEAKGTLVYCNDQYRKLFSLTSEYRQPGVHFRTILEQVARTGEQKGIPVGGEAQWVEETLATLARPGEQEINLADGRWLHIRTRPTRDGAVLVVASDMTKIMEAEHALLAMTSQLKVLATTDGLTGIMNRRAFDQALGLEVARSRRDGQKLSLLMIDVDRFKSYNDVYGHPAGDLALKAVSDVLTGVLKRPIDIAARYGGEEFAAILPGTDEDGAIFLADEFREALRALNVVHAGSESGVLTVSVGVTTLGLGDTEIGPMEMIRRADQALYVAKSSGRDRVSGWRSYTPAAGARSA